MIAIFKKLLWDEAYFQQYARAGAFLVGQLVLTGAIDFGKAGWWAAIPLTAAALFVRAGDRNAPPKP
jgi:hypothetical protein